jgi:hypothetical protein
MRQLLRLKIDGTEAKRYMPPIRRTTSSGRDYRPGPVRAPRNGWATDHQPGRCVDADRLVAGSQRLWITTMQSRWAE